MQSLSKVQRFIGMTYGTLSFHTARGAGNRCSVTTLELPVIAEPVLRIGFLQSAKASGEPRLTRGRHGPGV